MELADGSLKSSERVQPEEYSRLLSLKLKDAVQQVEPRFGHVWANVEAARLVEVAQTLKDDPDLDCAYLTFLSAVDWQEEGFELIVVVYSISRQATVVIKVPLPKENPSVPSITGVYAGANWHERECAEMFGIDFPGHPNLTGLYLPEDFEGHPLLKSFRLASRAFKPWPGAKDPSESGGRS